MNTNDFTLELSASRTPAQVFDAIRDVRAWWGAGIEGSADRIGDIFTYRHEDIHQSTQELVASVPQEKLVWLVTEARLSFVEKTDEWRGTRLVFDIAQDGARTKVRFTHEGLRSHVACFEACSKGWTYYVGESLRSLLTTGRGKPDAESIGRPRAVV